MTTVKIVYGGGGRWLLESTGELVAAGIGLMADGGINRVDPQTLGHRLSRALNATMIRHAGNLLIECWDPVSVNLIGQPAEELLVSIEIKDGNVNVLVPR